MIRIYGPAESVACDTPLLRVHLEALQDVRDQGAGEILGEAAECGRILLEETRKILRHFVLLPKDIRGVFVEHLSVAIDQRNFYGHSDQNAGNLSRRSIVGGWRTGHSEDDALQGGVGRFTRIVEQMVVSTSGELAHDRGRQLLLDLVAIALVYKSWNGYGLYILGKLDGVTGGVVTASRGHQEERRARPRGSHFH